MSKFKDLTKYLNYEFSSGPYTGEDYKQFQNKYIGYLKEICKQNNWELTNIGRNHYCFSTFFKNQDNKYIYLSISDVRGFSNEWFNNILIRTAENDKDYHGGRNNYCSLENLTERLSSLFKVEHKRFI